MAYYTHWPHSEVAAFSHAERRRWCSEISKINATLNDEPENIFKV